MIRLAWIGLTLVCALLGWSIAQGLAPFEPAASPRAAAADENPSRPAAPGARGNWAAAALARPLFSRDRRPDMTAQRATAQDDTGPPRLTGIVISPSGSQAIFAPAGGGKVFAVETGERIGDETVRAISRDGVIVESPSGQRLLTPSFQQQPPRGSGGGAGAAAELPLPGMFHDVPPSLLPAPAGGRKTGSP